VTPWPATFRVQDIPRRKKATLYVKQTRCAAIFGLLRDFEENMILNLFVHPALLAERFPKIDLGEDDLLANDYYFTHVSVFDHWLTEDEASSCDIMTFSSAMKANAKASYFEGERRFLNFYLTLAGDGVVCNRPLHGKVLSKNDPRLAPMLLASLREQKRMDVYFKSLRARVIGQYDRTDLVLVRDQLDLEKVRIAAENSGLYLLQH
jgi:hypothetical protein